MIKLIIFDLDGVLVDAREIHYNALNKALASFDEKFIIERDQHLSTYDGLPTRKKIQILIKEKGFPEDLAAELCKRKQHNTAEIIQNNIKKDDRLINILKELTSIDHEMIRSSFTVITGLINNNKYPFNKS